MPEKSFRAGAGTGLHLRCNPLRFLLFASPFVLGTVGLMLYDHERAKDLLPVALRNIGFFTVAMSVMGVIGYFTTYLVLDDRGLSIHYPFHGRTYRWDQLQWFQVQRQSLLFIKMCDVIHFGVAGQRNQRLLSMFWPSARELIALFEARKQLAAQEQAPGS